MQDIILRCNDCNKEFIFTAGEQLFYKKKGFEYPKKCQSCRTRGKQNSTLKTIISEWKRDAIKEKSKYFYDDGDISYLTNGEKYFVIGRKGAGKTAIADYIDSISAPKHLSLKISLKNFPFNELYNLTNDSYSAPNEYISIWKYVIYSYICKLMAQNQNIDTNILSLLNNLYGADTEKQLHKLIKKWTMSSFNVEALGYGIGITRSATETSHWIVKSEILENVILKFIDDSNYYIIIDELDENYTIFPTEEERKRYFDLITSLFKAVQDIKNIFDDYNNIRPLVFLREDIFNLIVDPDKNKWMDNAIYLKWDIAKIRNMLKHRFDVLEKKRFNSFDEAWNSIFTSELISYGTRQTKAIDSFSYINRLAQLRPRDFLEYIRGCAESALKKGELTISAQLVKSNNREFSNYLLAELRDEAHSVLPCFDKIIDILPIIRKQMFKFDEFASIFRDRKNAGLLDITISAEEVLEILFDYGIIGNAPKIKGKAIFRYEYPTAKLNLKESFIIHRGLYGALQIF